MNAPKVANAGGSLATNAKNGLQKAAGQTVEFAKNNSSMIITFLVLIVFVVCLYVGVNQWGSRSTANNVAVTTMDRKAIFDAKFSAEYKDKKSLKQATQDQAVTDRENCLINFQPLTVIHPGFLGPLQDGVFDERVGVTAAIRMGARCFILPIDYHTKETMGPTFPAPNVPCLLYRDSGDTVRSINGGSIAKAAQAIADVAWSDIVSQRNDPFILVLYFLRTPEQQTKAYLDFLSQVAVELAPLSPYLLGQTPDGVYNRQANQDKLLFVNTNQLEKKLLVFSNADTTGFRTANRDFKHTYVPKEDLDYWVHLRIYKQNLDSSYGVTTTPEASAMPRSFVESISYFTSLPSDPTTKKNTTDSTKQKFTIALPKAEQTPPVKQLETLLDTYGVQSVPLLLIDYTPEIQSALSKWKYAWRAKPKEIRYVRPEPIVVAAQNPIVNARGGMISVPTT
jgi:hypothetical protein